MNIQTPFSFASVYPLGVWRSLGLRLRGLCHFQAFLASSPCAASAGSSGFRSPWPVRSLSFLRFGSKPGAQAYPHTAGGLSCQLEPSMSEATVGWLVLSSIAVASALGWHLLLRSFLLATVLATATAVILFQVAAYLYAGYLDPFFLVAVITSSVICLLITITVGMLVRNIKGKNNAL